MSKREIETCHSVEIECIAERSEYSFNGRNEHFSNWYLPAKPKRVVIVHYDLNTWFRMTGEEAIACAKERALNLRRKKIVRDFKKNNPEYSISYRYKVFECTMYEGVYPDNFLTKKLIGDLTIEHK